MRLNIFLLLYFFVAIFTFGIAVREEPRYCNSNKNGFFVSDRLVRPQNNRYYEEWSRFIDGKYVMVGRDSIDVWVNIISKTKYITLQYDIVRDGGNKMDLEPFGIKECRQNFVLQGKRNSLTVDISLCGCKLKVKNGYAYLPMRLRSDRAPIKISFAQVDRRNRVTPLGIYVSEKENERWANLKLCPNKDYLLEEERIYAEKEKNKQGLPPRWDGREISNPETSKWTFEGRKPFYSRNGFDYVDLYKRDTVIFLLVPEENWDKFLYLIIELQDGKKLHQDVEIKIEVNGIAPHKDYEPYGESGLRIIMQHRQCLQTYSHLGIIRYVIRVSEPDLLTVSFKEFGRINWPTIISLETVAIYQGERDEAISNNNFTTYILKYNGPPPEPTRPPPPIQPAPVTELPPTFPPTRSPDVAPTIPPAPVTDLPPSFSSTRSIIENPSIQSSSTPSKKTPTATSKSHKPPLAVTPSNDGKNSTTEKSESAALIPDFDDCDNDSFLWLLIIVICIDVILVIVLILLIIFAHRGSKKMKAAMAKKKMKDPKAAATPPKQDAATATSPMATTPSKKEAKGKKMKPAEKEAKGKTTGGGKKSTDGKTTTFYTVDQTKYYTIDNTFDKSKKRKK